MALSSRARRFSVEALVGKRKPEETPETEEENDEEPEKRPKSAAPLSPDCAPDPTGDPGNRTEAELQGGELWRRFHHIGTEMIITKAGRRMFPSVRVKVKGLEPCKQYHIAMDIIPVDSKRYRYVYHSSQWMVAGNTDHSCVSPRLYFHPDSPSSGDAWMRQIISFDRVKLTNNEMDDKGHIILQSMHRYRPRVHVIGPDSCIDLSKIQSLPAEGVKSFSFKETEFTTVTAYQNQQITKLKIDRNPFAKGFRDPGRNRGVLDGLLETYPWRPTLALEFKAFGMEAAGPGSSSLTPPGGAASPLLSPSCSPPTFPLGLLYSENFVPLCYRICPRTQSLLRPPGALSLDFPLLSAFSLSKPSKLDPEESELRPLPTSPAPLLPAPEGTLPAPALLHPSYSVYSYNLSVPHHCMASATLCPGPRDYRARTRWTLPANHLL